VCVAGGQFTEAAGAVDTRLQEPGPHGGPRLPARRLPPRRHEQRRLSDHETQLPSPARLGHYRTSGLRRSAGRHCPGGQGYITEVGICLLLQLIKK